MNLTAASLKVIADVAMNGGSTVSLIDEETPEDGFMVSIKGHESKVGSELTEESVSAYVAIHRLLTVPGHYLGAWQDVDNDGTIYLDTSIWHWLKGDANQAAIMNEQLAYYDLARGVAVYV